MPQKTQEWLPNSLDERSKSRHQGSERKIRKSSSKRKKESHSHNRSAEIESCKYSEHSGQTSLRSDHVDHMIKEQEARYKEEKKSNKKRYAKETRTRLRDDDVDDVVLQHCIHKPSTRSKTRVTQGYKTPTSSRIQPKSIERRDSYAGVVKNHKHTFNEVQKEERAPQKISIDVNGGSSNNCFDSCLSNKKIVLLIVLYAIIATGLWTLFFNWSWELPGKQQQIDALEEQVDLLDQETEELRGQLDRLDKQVRISNNENVETSNLKIFHASSSFVFVDNRIKE